jgi:hypothetical protein
MLLDRRVIAQWNYSSFAPPPLKRATMKFATAWNSSVAPGIRFVQHPNSVARARAPALLRRDLNLVERILRDYLSEDYVAIRHDNEEGFAKVVEFLGRFQPNMVARVKL